MACPGARVTRDVTFRSGSGPPGVFRRARSGGREPFGARIPPGVAQAGFSGSVWGTEGPEFKSRQPDKQIPDLNRRFIAAGVSRRTTGVRSGRASLEMASRSVDERQDAAGEWAGGIEVLDDQAEAFDDPEAVLDVAGVVRTAVTQGHQALDHGLHGLDLIGS